VSYLSDFSQLKTSSPQISNAEPKNFGRLNINQNDNIQVQIEKMIDNFIGHLIQAIVFYLTPCMI
jgi:hypothetical protein